LQAELFDDLNNLQSGVELLNPELNIYTSLPAHLGGIQTRIPDDVMERETAEDFELRVQLEAGTVPTVDTILRYILIPLNVFVFILHRKNPISPL